MDKRERRHCMGVRRRCLPALRSNASRKPEHARFLEIDITPLYDTLRLLQASYAHRTMPLRAKLSALPIPRHDIFLSGRKYQYAIEIFRPRLNIGYAEISCRCRCYLYVEFTHIYMKIAADCRRL